MVSTKRIAVTGAGGFIGDHLVRALRSEGHFVRGVDLHGPFFRHSQADEFKILDLRDKTAARKATYDVDEVYALAADMGGMGYIAFHDADILTSNIQISVNTIESAWQNGVRKLIYSSSACVYPEYRQETERAEPLIENEAYPAAPQDGYGWEKLLTERLLEAYQADGRLDVRIARLHNIFGEYGTWEGGREKAPAALCRKVAEARQKDNIPIWGDGNQTRSFCYIDDCIEGLLRLAASDWQQPLNIGSDRLISIDALADLIIGISGKDLLKCYVTGPQGVRGRNSSNFLCRKVLDWSPQVSLEEGLAKTYSWIQEQVTTSV